MAENVYTAPFALYELCLDSILEWTLDPRKSTLRIMDLHCLPNRVMLDLYEKIFNENRLCFAQQEYIGLVTFNSFLRVKDKHVFLLRYYQWMLNRGYNVLKVHLDSYESYISDKTSKISEQDLIEIGLRMGEFLIDGGWYNYSISFLDATEQILRKFEEDKVLLKLMELYGMKLYAESLYCAVIKSLNTFEKTVELAIKGEQLDRYPFQQLADVYCSLSVHHFVYCSFKMAYEWVMLAFELLPSGLSKKTIINVLRQASKTCAVKKNFLQANMLIEQAYCLAKCTGPFPLLLFADILMDYGFCLLNSDNVGQSLYFYGNALNIFLDIFHSHNLNIAVAYKDLAYALYLYQYNFGRVYEAGEYVEAALYNMESILPEDHFFQFSARRVKALILEEIALHLTTDSPTWKILLKKAKHLHISALKSSFKLFGNRNLYTARHYGNLARLYQSMGLWKEAEKLHQQAIFTKETLLGPNDYEVGISLGHLASLYNYQMKKYPEAEDLYLRSIDINIRFFGLGYSGLEYDYRGLISIYEKTLDVKRSLFYQTKLTQWEEYPRSVHGGPPDIMLMAPKDIVRRFFQIYHEEIQLQTERDEHTYRYASRGGICLVE